VLDAETIEAALDPVHYLGSTDTFINRAVRAFEALQPVKAGR
jgi:hypothetical protein